MDSKKHSIVGATHGAAHGATDGATEAIGTKTNKKPLFAPKGNLPLAQAAKNRLDKNKFKQNQSNGLPGKRRGFGRT